ncbi:hypothetical protein ACIQ7D_14240 [Streptomyces sp. NPDC096310]|uniref:arsenate reductase/protein-tyrosine-phosphatase family protein n=1 Tax=Streptomyces sp. NPDC096310 TaxID=3366082 RepID=UPI0037FB423F
MVRASGSATQTYQEVQKLGRGVDRIELKLDEVQVSPELMEWADTVLAMDKANLAALRNLAGEHTAGKVALYLGDEDVPDPWGQNEAAFASCVETILTGAQRHLR